MGAVAITEIRQQPDLHLQQGTRAVLAKITLSSSYATGGDTLSLGTLGFNRVHAMYVFSSPTSTRVRGTTVAPQAGRGARVELAGTAAVPLIKVTEGGASPAEPTATTDLSGSSFYAILVGE